MKKGEFTFYIKLNVFLRTTGWGSSCGCDEKKEGNFLGVTIFEAIWKNFRNFFDPIWAVLGSLKTVLKYSRSIDVLRF